MNRKKIFLYLFFTFSICWLTALIMHITDVEYGSIPFVILVAVFYMFIPAAVTIVLQKYIYKEPLAEYGFTIKNISVKHIFLTPAYYLAFILLTIAIVFILGNILHIPGFGAVSFQQEDVTNGIVNLIHGKFDDLKIIEMINKMPSPFILFLLGIFGGIFSGASVNLLFTFGEEFGWRGLLLRETQPMGFWKANFFIGIIWGVWHIPIILMGHNYPHYPVLGSLMMIPFCISLSFIQAYLRLRSKTILAPSLFHGMINAGGPVTFIFFINYNELLGTIVGAAGILSAIIVTVVILLSDKKFIEEYKML